MPRFLKYGITTGATAAAAAKAAVLTVVKDCVDKVVIPTPIGIRFEIPVKECKRIDAFSAEATVIKNAGDDIDVTNGIDIVATITVTDNDQITIKKGVGVGTVTKPGLQVPIGDSAINPVPKKMISDAVKEALPTGKGADVVITVPEGEKIAEKTLNAKLGIIGGISILGSTGVVKPLSLEACRKSLVPQIDVALANGYEKIFMVPGNIGERIVKQQFNPPDDQIIQTGDFVGYMLDKAAEKGVKEITYLGHPGKLTKVAAGIFNTHHKVGDARNEVVAAYAASAGADTQTVNKILRSNTTQEAAQILGSTKLRIDTFNNVAKRVHERLRERTKNKIRFSVIIVSMEGEILGKHENELNV